MRLGEDKRRDRFQHRHRQFDYFVSASSNPKTAVSSLVYILLRFQVVALLLAVLYSLEAYIMYKAWRSGATMSASRTTTTTQPAV